MEPQVVASVDERCSPLVFVNKEAEEMGLVWVVKTLDTSLGDDAAVVGGHNQHVLAFGRTEVSMLVWAMASWFA